MQGNGAEMLRLAAWRLCEAGIIPNMLIHDGVLLEVRDKEQTAQAIEIMKAAGRDVCGGLEIGVDIDQRLEHGARYKDKRPVAKEMWSSIVRVLADVGAIPQEQGYGQDTDTCSVRHSVSASPSKSFARRSSRQGGGTSRSKLIGSNFRRGGLRPYTTPAVLLVC